MNTNQTNCQNCEKPINEGFKFCPNCGQKTNDELTIGVLFYNTISNYFSFDARFLKSFIPLMFKPGYLAKRFLEGKRLFYLHPAQMYLFVSVLFFFVFSFTVNDWIEEADKVNTQLTDSSSGNYLGLDTNKNMDSIVLNALKNEFKPNEKSSKYNNETQVAIDSLIKSIENNKEKNKSSINFGISKKKIDSLRNVGAADDVIYKEMGMDEDASGIQRGYYKSLLQLSEGNGLGNLIKRYVDTVPIAMFFLLPLFALLLKIFYYNKGRYSHHLVFSFYFFSFLFTVLTLLLAFHRFIYEIPIAISVLIILSVFVYFLIALQRFYKNFWMLTFIKSGVITFTFMLLVLPLSAVIIAVFALVNS